MTVIKVLSEDGFIEIENVKIGNKVFGEDGKLHNVIGTHIQENKKLYRITFSDRTSIECCEEHLWTYQKPQDKAKEVFRTESLKDIMKQSLYKETNRGDKNWQFFIPLTKPIEFKEQPILLDAYLLGVLLGDGYLGGNNREGISVSLPEQDIKSKLIEILDQYDYTLKYNDKYDYRINPQNYKPFQKNNIVSIIKELKLYNTKSYNKFIPKEYLYNSIDIRLSVLKGLIDTDGEVRGSSVCFCTTSHQLALDVQFLIQSMGGTAYIENRQTYYTYNKEKRKGLPSYRIHIKISSDIEVFSSDKHSSNYKKGNTSPKRTIKNIEYIGEKDYQGILTDNPSLLYLTNDFIVIHS